jgi:MFS superfamily sulfate permease-like transporter
MPHGGRETGHTTRGELSNLPPAKALVRHLLTATVCPGTQGFRELDEHPEDEQFRGIVVLRLDGGLFFATSDASEDRVREVALSTPVVAGIVLDCEGMDFIDSQAPGSSWRSWSSRSRQARRFGWPA